MAAVDPFAEELRRRGGASPEDAERGREEAGTAGDPFAQELARRQGAEAAGDSAEADDAGGYLDPIVSSLKSTAGGALDVLGLPADLVNIPLRAAGLPTFESGADDLRAMAAEHGLAYERDEEPDTAAARAHRIAGSAVVPAAGPFARAGSMARGAQTARGATSSKAAAEGARIAPVDMVPTAQSSRLAAEGARRTGFVDDTARAVAARPGATATAEGASVAGATAGGEGAEAIMPESEIAEALGELAGGLSPTMAAYAPSSYLPRKLWQGAKATAVPFTRAGAEPRAARRLQDAAADPDLAAERTTGSDTLAEAPLSPAQRSGDKRLRGIERTVADADPELDAKLEADAAEATATARASATDLEGETGRPREILERSRRALLDRVNQRALQAAQEAQEAIDRLDPGATPRQISEAARGKVEEALSDTQRTERQLWESLDQDAPASLDSTRGVIDSELAKRSRFEDPDDIPAWLTQALRSDGGEILDSRGNPIRQDGSEVTFGDVHALRKRVGAAIGEERAKPSPNRNKTRILGNVYDALLEDMGSAEGQGEALDQALAFSRELNRKFRQGAVGRLLGYERRGGLAVDPADTVRRIVSGQASGTQVREFLEAAPEAREEVAKYLRTAYLSQTVGDGLVNPNAARQFLKKHSEVLDQLPELRQELADTREMNRRALRFDKRARDVERLAHATKKSRAALYLDADVGDEWDAVFRSQDPAKVARGLRRKMGKDRKALQGLKASFVEDLIRKSETTKFDAAGQPGVSGNRLRRLFADFDDVTKALEFSDAERERLRRVVNTLSRLEVQPTRGEEVMTDRPAAFLDLIARWMGAQSGQRVASDGTGSSLVMAQAFSQRMRNLLGRLTRDKATGMVSASVQDPELFRALLTAPTASPKTQSRAAQKLGAWLGSPASQSARGDGDRRDERQRIDAAAEEAATSPANGYDAPSEAEKKAGNYRKGHIRLHGLDISVENPKGSKRSGTDRRGRQWESQIQAHYGYIKGTEGADGEPLDVFLGPEAEAERPRVFIVDQVDPKTQRFDETKILFGYPDKDAARRGYLANYEKGWKGLGSIREFTLPELKLWIDQGNTRRRVTRQNERRADRGTRRSEARGR